MRNQRHTTDRSGLLEDAAENGSSIATLATVLKEQDLGVDFSSVHPIDTLLVQQLEDILESEKALRARYSALDPLAHTTEARQAFARELSKLKDRADRLYRLMNAMDYYGPFEPSQRVLTAPAVA